MKWRVALSCIMLGFFSVGSAQPHVDSLRKELTFQEGVFLDLLTSPFHPIFIEDQSTLVWMQSQQDPILFLLQEQQRMMWILYGQMDSLRRTMADMQQSQEYAHQMQMQKQIDDLRKMVIDMARMNGDAYTADNGEHLALPQSATITDIPSSISLYFTPGSYQLDLQAILVLNEVMEIMAHQRLNLIIKGYADQTGDPNQNLWISKKRAAEVKKTLLENGITSPRITLQYWGESQTEQVGDERKVTIEFTP
jgi:outer membrane protein OmpA-like peptidoglycan-associated protein